MRYVVVSFVTLTAIAVCAFVVILPFTWLESKGRTKLAWTWGALSMVAVLALSLWLKTEARENDTRDIRIRIVDETGETITS